MLGAAALCLLAAGAPPVELPTDTVTLAWTHTIEKIGWRELWTVEAGELRLLEARVQGSGAGMEPGSGAVLRENWWVWRPERQRVPGLTLARAPGIADYQLCWGGDCHRLGDLLGPAADAGTAELRPCSSAAGSP